MLNRLIIVILLCIYATLEKLYSKSITGAAKQAPVQKHPYVHSLSMID